MRLPRPYGSGAEEPPEDKRAARAEREEEDWRGFWRKEIQPTLTAFKRAVVLLEDAAREADDPEKCWQDPFLAKNLRKLSEIVEDVRDDIERAFAEPR